MSDQLEFAAASGFSGSTQSRSGITLRRAAFTSYSSTISNIITWQRPGTRKARSEGISRSLLGGRDRKTLYKQVQVLAKEGKSGSEIGRFLNISCATAKYWALKANDFDLLQLLRVNGRQAKGKGGLMRKGKPSKLKGKTYAEIFKDDQKAKARAAQTSSWMKTEKNIRRFCKSPSKPQLKLFNEIKQKYPTAVLEHPIKVAGHNSVIWLDIAVVELKLNFEYDGHYWHKINQQSRNLKDSHRDELLRAAGWTIVRVKGEEK